ncbi:MAG: helix-turn-helix transcriptional regulator [Lachnospiraceae bacterium]|nr:helix-turn-helix transcriptional regulator [Lachnospiraceae bacterium]
MQLNLGVKIRELRRRDDRTQEALADTLGVTSQAVSRWEAGGSYPDMEMIPAIANYFGITIDELFGYQNNRDAKIDAIIDKINSLDIPNRGDGEWIDEGLMILREGLAEFPRNERLLISLAETLHEAGWRRHDEWIYYDVEGFIQYSYDTQKKNVYWSEAVKVCENLLGNAMDQMVVSKATSLLVSLYRVRGESEKAISCAMRMPSIKECREYLLAGATDGKQEAMYIGNFLLKAAREFADKLVYGLIANRKHYDSDLPIEKVKGAIAIFYLICDDGNMGQYHNDLIKLNLYLSRLQWERGYHDEAFVSLDAALEHARALDAVCDGKEHFLTAPLVSFVKFDTEKNPGAAKLLPAAWPIWGNPDYSEIKKEIEKDPRWQAWVERTQN